MIDFANELAKFEPVLEIEDVDDGLAQSDAKDVMELLQYLFASSSAESGGE